MKRAKFKAAMTVVALTSVVYASPLVTPIAFANSDQATHHTTTAHRTTFVTIGKKAGNQAICAAIKSYLERTSSPSLFRHITIEKVAPVGDTWEVHLLVHHQPGKFSPYNEGVNIRFVQLNVLSLASGR